MKLNNNQIEAICNEAQRQHDAKANAKPVLLTTEMVKEAEQISKALLSLSTPVFKDLLGYHGSDKFKTIQYWEKWLLEKAQPKKSEFDRREFKDKIHLASIDAEDLKALYSKLKIKL